MKILVFLLFAAPNILHASIPGLSGHYVKEIVFSQLDAASKYPLDDSKKCQKQIVNITQDGQMSIFVAFGYIDYSAGQEVIGSSLYQYGDVLDLDARQAYENALTRSCTNGYSSKIKTFACGFSKNGNTFKKTITDRFTGNRVNVIVTLASSAYSSNDQSNKTTYTNQQNSKSQTTHSQFLQALQNYDVILYVGHARKGGGPDFYPPRLLNNGHVNYAYYQQNKPGLTSMLTSLKGSSPDMLGLFACRSTPLFAQSTKKTSPYTGLITSGSLFGFNDLIRTGFNTIESVVSQRCNESFSNVVENQLSGDMLGFFF